MRREEERSQEGDQGRGGGIRAALSHCMIDKRLQVKRSKCVREKIKKTYTEQGTGNTG